MPWSGCCSEEGAWANVVAAVAVPGDLHCAGCCSDSKELSSCLISRLKAFWVADRPLLRVHSWTWEETLGPPRMVLRSSLMSSGSPALVAYPDRPRDDENPDQIEPPLRAKG